MNRQKKQKQRKISSSGAGGRPRTMPVGMVQMEISGRPTPEQIAHIESLGPLGYRSLAAYRMLLRQLMGAAVPILQAKMDWRVAADVPSTVWFISQATTSKYLFTGLRNADGHDIEQVRVKIAGAFPGTIVVRPHASGEVWFHLQHVGLGGDVQEIYRYRHAESEPWLGLLIRPGLDEVVLEPNGMGIPLPSPVPVEGTPVELGASP